MKPLKSLSDKHLSIHQEAVELTRNRGEIEARLITVLQQVQREKIYLYFGCTSLFKYAVDVLGHSESVAQAFIAVSRKASEVPELQEALTGQALSVSKASRVISALNRENAKEVLEFAKGHSSRQIDAFVAAKNPKALKRDRIRPISGSHVEIQACLSNQVLEKLRRIQNLIGKDDLESALDTMTEFYLDRRDPIRKADRARARLDRTDRGRSSDLNCKVSSIEGSSSPRNSTAPATLELRQVSRLYVRARSAKQEHIRNGRDRGRCTFIDATGKRCENERWLHAHHIHHVSRGGSNEASNLVTLCAPHHDLVHQLSLPLDGVEARLV